MTIFLVSATKILKQANTVDEEWEAGRGLFLKIRMLHITAMGL